MTVYTVPWCPELGTDVIGLDELPGPAVALIQAVERYAQRMRLADDRELAAALWLELGVPEVTALKAVWLAEHFGVIARLPRLTTTRRGST